MWQQMDHRFSGPLALVQVIQVFLKVGEVDSAAHEGFGRPPAVNITGFAGRSLIVGGTGFAGRDSERVGYSRPFFDFASITGV